jgi:hypothetical protein
MKELFGYLQPDMHEELEERQELARNVERKLKLRQ